MKVRPSVAEYRVRLPEAPTNAHQRWTERSGLILTLDAPEGLFGQGEAAPLPGYSDDALVACRDALSALDPLFLETLTESPVAELGPALEAELGLVPPSALFALETALYDLRARRLGVPMFRLLRELVRKQAEPARLELVALLRGSPEQDWQAQALSALEAGYAGVKVKVGLKDQFERELLALRRLRSTLGPSAVIRLDANGAFLKDSVRDRLLALSTVAPEFIEEPLVRGAGWLSEPPIAVALDESLRDRPVLTQAVAERHRFVAAVLKLGPLGGFTGTLRIRETTAAAGLASVVSHTFEGPVGMAAAAEFALALGPGQYAPGLSPHGGLSEWPCGLPAAYAGPALAPHAEAGLGLSRVVIDERSGAPR